MYKKVFLGFALTAAAAGAMAAGLSVTGSIVPASCTITLGGNGVASLGDKTVAQVQAYDKTTGDTGAVAYFYPEPALADLSVTCPSATPLALKFTDNKEASLLVYNNGMDTANGSFGLGTHNGLNIGRYSIVYGNLKVANGGTAQAYAKALRRGPTGGAWAAYTNNWVPGGGAVLSLANSASATAPTALTEISGSLAIWPLVNAAVVDSATGPIQIDGSATIALVYL